MERLNAIIDWEMFRLDFDSIDRKERTSAARRRPTDRVRISKMLVLQNLYGLPDDAFEYQVTDRLTCMRFPGIDLGGAVLDAKTVRLFREQLRDAKAFDWHFERFHCVLAMQRIKLNSGKIVDTSFVEALRRRNGRRLQRSSGRTIPMRAGPKRRTRTTLATRTT